MKSLTKFWAILIVLSLISLVFPRGVYSQDFWVEHSIAYQKNAAPLKDLNKLFSELGIIPEEKNGRLNPCFDLEGYVDKYCTIRGMELLIHEHNFVSVEEQLLEKFLRGKDACGDTAQYIGRVCQLTNFKKIMKHFALEK